MEYSALAEQLLNALYALGKNKRTKEIGSNMKGESFTLLYLAMSEKPVSPGDLVSSMEISSARVAALLNTLEKKGLIFRAIDPADRRKILIRLTDTGKEKAESARVCSMHMMTQMMEWIGREDAEHLIRIIGKVTDHISEMSVTEKEKEETDVIEN